MAEVKSVNRGALLGMLACGIDAVRFSVPSRWQVLHTALPRNSCQPAISWSVSVALPARNASNFDENALTSGEIDEARWRSYLKLRRELRHAAAQVDPNLRRMEKERWKKLCSGMKRNQKRR